MTRNTLHYPSTIAIDGPVASGKSTIGELLADRLGYFYFDTGVMYRAVAWAALERGIDPWDDQTVGELARSIRIDVTPPSVHDGRQYTVLADGVDITWDIRSPAVDTAVSPVSANPEVRAALTPQQRRIARDGRIVMAGRDIGTVVLPDADLKVYLDASPRERARRRYEEIKARGGKSSFEEVLQALIRRDEYDSGRETAPLRRAPEAIVVDSTHLAVQETLNRVMSLVEGWAHKGGTDMGTQGATDRWPVLGPVPNRRKVLRPILRFLIHSFLRVEMDGAERIPQVGPVILMVNHIHLLDPVVLVGMVERYAVAMGKEEIMHWPIVGPVVLRYPTIPVRRGDLDMVAMRQALTVLQAGHVLIIAPEGTRSRAGSLQEGKKGMVFLAQRSDSVILPVAVTGTPGFPAKLRSLRRVPVRYRFGRPFRFRWPAGKLHRDTMQQLVDQAMYELAKLLPPEMRGVYGDLGLATTDWLEFEEESGLTP